MPAPTRDAFIANLKQHYGASHADAERAWARTVGATPALAGVVLDPEDTRALEQATQREVVKLFRAFGGTVYSLSQARASKQTPGLPDLWVAFVAHGLAFWWETKRPTGGKLSPAQVDFASECEATQTWHGSGARRAAEDFLIAQGIAERTPEGVMEPVRATHGLPREMRT